MPGKPASKACPCGSGAPLETCCGPILNGAPATSPEALMRSRYTAYALGHVRHLIRTTHPLSPHARPDDAAWAVELSRYCASVRFTGLEVLEASASGDVGHVSFVARLRHGGQDAALRERSRFERLAGRWTYRDGDPLPR